MKKKILIGGILVILMLVTIPFASVAEFNNETTDEEIPLFLGTATLNVRVSAWERKPNGRIDKYYLSGAGVNLYALWFDYDCNGVTDDNGRCTIIIDAPLFEILYGVYATMGADHSRTICLTLKAGDEKYIQLTIQIGCYTFGLPNQQINALFNI